MHSEAWLRLAQRAHAHTCLPSPCSHPPTRVRLRGRSTDISTGISTDISTDISSAVAALRPGAGLREEDERGQPRPHPHARRGGWDEWRAR
jgi:hypothetical protein